MPAGKYTTAGVVVDEAHPSPQRPPALMAALMAAYYLSVPIPRVRVETYSIISNSISFCAVRFHVTINNVSTRTERRTTLMGDGLVPIWCCSLGGWYRKIRHRMDAWGSLVVDIVCQVTKHQLHRSLDLRND